MKTLLRKCWASGSIKNRSASKTWPMREFHGPTHGKLALKSKDNPKGCEIGPAATPKPMAKTLSIKTTEESGISRTVCMQR